MANAHTVADSCTATGTAYVAEMFDPVDSGRLTARFTVHWADNAGRSWAQGPEGVSVREAIEWGRRHADVVYVRLGEEEVPFSAGVSQPPGGDFPGWPAEGIEVRPRPFGSPRDGSLQTVAWLLRSVVEIGLRDDAALQSFREALEKADEVVGVQSATRGERTVTLIYKVVADSYSDAVDLGDERLKHIARQMAEPAADGTRPSIIATSTSSWQAP